MSYDLLFYAPSDQIISATALREYFQNRPHFQLKDQQAWYENEDTGVYFSYDLTPSEPDDENPRPSVASFNMNYFRPHIFGLEAEPEVSTFVQTFNLGIEDPQISGMGDGPYTREGFLQGWNKGNEFGYKSIVSQHGRSSVKHVLPGDTIERYWRWNFGSAALQESLGKSAFVPHVMFFEYEHRVVSGIAWPDAIPVALPPVDLYFIAREQFARRRLFSTKPEFAITTIHDIEPLVSQYSVHEGPIRFRLLNYAKQPSHLVDWVRSLQAGDPKLKTDMVAVDQILDSEIVDKIATTLP